MAQPRWPLVGRSTELEIIAQHRAEHRRPAAVVIGACGVGKTRLAQEALAQAQAAGWETIHVVATRSAAAVPLGALSPLLPAGVAGGALDAMRALVADLAERGRHRPIMLAVDDGHLLDGASAALVHLLATGGAVSVLVTVRSGEPAPDAITALLHDDSAARIPLGVLDPATMEALIDAAVGGPMDGISRRELRRLAGGNPLILREVVWEGRTGGMLRQQDGVWRWRGPLRDGVFLADLVASHVAGAEPATRAALETVACGEPLPLHLLETLVGAAAIEAAERSGVLVIGRSRARLVVRLAQAVYGDIIRARMPVSRARDISASLARVLTKTPMRRRDDLVLASLWQLRAGAIDRPQVVLDAARQALSRGDLPLAERLARGLAAASPTPEVERLLAAVLQGQGRYAEAAAILPAVPADAPAAEQAMWTTARASILYWGFDRTREADELLDSAVDVPALALRCWIHLFEGRCLESVAAGRQVLDRPGTDPDAVVRAAVGVTAAAALGGLFDQAIAARDRALYALPEAESPWVLDQIGYATCLALFAAGRLREAWTTADQGYAAAVAAAAAAPAACWLAFRGVVEKAQGRVRTATASLREAVVLLADDDPFRIRHCCLAKLASAAALSGEHERAQAWIAQADAEHRDANKLFAPWVELDRAWLLAGRGELSDARQLAIAAAEQARASGQLTFEAVARYDLARLGGIQDAQPRLRELAGLVQGQLAQVLATAAEALQASDGPALDYATTALDDLGLVLLAAETGTAAARAYRRSGSRARAAAASARAAQLVQACEGARTPLLESVDLMQELTDREREVVWLAARRYRSQEIAQHLGVSIRTVDNHLGRAYAKLGINGREQLSALFGRRVAPPPRRSGR